jgi:hypothetical protein
VKITLYSCIASAYDEPIPIGLVSDRVDSCIMFTDNHAAKAPGWEVRALASPSGITQPNLINRYHKFFPHRVLDDVDVSIYIDGNIRIIKDIGPLLDSFIGSDKEIGVFSHPQRKNIVEETCACINLNKFSDEDKIRVVSQLEFYAKEKYRLNSELYAATVLFRRHRNLDILDKTMSLWWEQINKYCARDQISLPYVLWKSGVPYKVYNIDIFDNPYFQRLAHGSRKSLVNKNAMNNIKSYLRKFRKK